MLGGYEQDTAPEGDMAFVGVNMRLRPPLLPAGYMSAATNARFDKGSCARRKGFAITPWANLGTEGYPVSIVSGPLQGIAVFKDPDETKWIVFAVDGATYYTRPHMTARNIPLPDGVTIDGQTLEFVQANGALYMFRGTEAAPLRLRSVGGGWEEIIQFDNDAAYEAQNPDDGTEMIPNAEWAICLQNRLIVPNVELGRDVLSISDYFNVTRYQPTLESFRVSQPDDEAIVGAFPIPTPDDTPSSALLVCKETQNFVVSGVAGDLSGLGRQDVTGDYGFSLRRAIWRVGRDLWGVVPKRGVFSLSQTSQNKWQGIDVPISQEIQPVFDRINWRYADRIRAVKVGNFSYIAVPLDDAVVQSGPPVFDTGELTNLIPPGATYSEGSYNLAPLMTTGTWYMWIPAPQDHAGVLEYPQLDFFTPFSGPHTIFYGSDTPAGKVFQRGTETLAVLRGRPGLILDKLYDLTPDKTVYPWVCRYVGDLGDVSDPPYLHQSFIPGPTDGVDGIYIDTFTRDPAANTQAEIQGRPWVYVSEGVVTGTGTFANSWWFMDASAWPNVYAYDEGEVGPPPAEVVANLGVEPPPFLIPYTLPTTNANNAILVYDHVNKAWCGYDTGVSVFDMFPFPVDGVERLLVLSNQGFLGIYEEGDVNHGFEILDDQLVSTVSTEIEHTWSTRGYAMRSKLGRFRVVDAGLQLQTFNPQYTITAQMDGVNESKTLCTDKTRDRRKYFRPHTARRYVPTNANDDHARPFREDYSLDFTGGVNRNTTGVNGGLLQEASEHFRPPKGTRGQYVVISGSNNQGECDLHAVALESVRVDTNRKGIKA